MIEVQITYANRKKQAVFSFSTRYPFVRTHYYRKLGKGAWYPVVIKEE